MKTLTKTMLIVLIVLCVAIDAKAQRGYLAGNFYQYQGGENIQCGPHYRVSKNDGWNYWVEVWQNCRKMQWYQEYREGYIYLWGRNGWYTEWRRGNFWRYNWFDFPSRVY